MASGFTICKNALPTWHDKYDANTESTATVDLDDITVTSFNNATNCTTIDSYGKARLCNNTATDATILEKTVPTVPKYLYENKERFVFKGCAPNVANGLKRQKFIQENGELKRTEDGKLTFKDLTLINSDAPYLIYFELIGGGGGGGGSKGNIFSSTDGSGGGSGSAVAGVLDFTKYRSYFVIIGSGGSGGTPDSEDAAKDGSLSALEFNNYAICAYGGKGGKGGGKGAGDGGSTPEHAVLDSLSQDNRYYNQVSLSEAGYYSDISTCILNVCKGSAGTGSDGGTLSGEKTVYFFGEKGHTSFESKTIGSGGSGQGDNGVGKAGSYGGGGAGAIYKNVGNHTGGDGGKGALLLFW